MNPKVLIGCPTSIKKEYCTFDWIDNIKRFTYPNSQIMLVDNTAAKDEKPGMTFQQRITEKGVRCHHVDPIGNATQFVARSANILRAYALANGFDYLMMVEIDNFPPPYIIEKLLTHRKPIVGLSYLLNNFDPLVPNMGVLTTYGVYTQNNQVNPPLSSFSEFNGTLRKYTTNSIGCTLISSHALQHIRFRADANHPAVFHDSWFFIDAKSIGFDCWVDTSEICEHRRGTWHGNTDLIKQFD